MHSLSFDKLRQRYRGKYLVIAGNGPSVSALDAADLRKLPIFTVNAGLHLLNGYRRSGDLLWLQDTRMMVEKPHLVLPYLSDNIAVLTPHTVALPKLPHPDQHLRFNALGNDGFSYDPRIGAFSGYTAIFGLLQLVRWIGPTKITMVGVDLGYGATSTRAYQARRGLDVDLHINDRQIAATQHALRVLEKSGIEIDHRSKDSVLQSALSVS